MSLDPQKVAECRAWLGRAWADLDSAAILLAAQRPRPDTALFHCQQAAEKTWKAFLFWHDVPFRKTHNLRELGEACARVDGSLASLAERAEDLTWQPTSPTASTSLARKLGATTVLTVTST